MFKFIDNYMSSIFVLTVIDGSMLRTEERQRLARERREEREKQHGIFMFHLKYNFLKHFW